MPQSNTPVPPPGKGAGRDPVFLGLMLGFLSFALFSFSDASVKLIEGSLPPVESAFFGALFGLAVLPFLRKPAEPWRDIFATTHRPLWLLRFLSYPIGVMGSVTAFTLLPMAEAFALIFLQPAYVTVISTLFLKEKVGARRWLAVLIGFVGVLIVLRPGFRELSLGHLGAVIAGLGGAIAVITFRVADPAEKKISLFGAGIIGGVLVCGLVMLPGFRWPDAMQWLWLAGYGLLAALANLSMMVATRLAPASWIGPTQYSQMLWAILFGYLLFGDHLDRYMVIGIVLIVASGLLTLLRERQRNIPLPTPLAASNPQAAATLRPDDGPGSS